jgi:EmrB/QacA subfamily drug resistance transporter
MNEVQTAPALVKPAADPQPGVGSPSYRWMAASIIALGSIAWNLSITVVNVGVPTLQRAFHASLTDVQWVATGYLLGLSAVIPISGWVTDRFGAKRTYVGTLALLTVASLLCGFATSIGTEIAFRVVQGMAGGLVMPVGMTMLMRITPPHERGRMLGVIGIPMMVAPSLGPLLAGWLIEHFSWPYMFWINIPFCVLALGFAAQKLRDSKVAPGGPFDLVGFLLCTPAVTVFVYGVTMAANSGWGSAAVLLPMMSGVVLCMAFVAWELHTPYPMLELRVLRDAAYSASLSVSILIAAGMFGAIFAVPVFMQQVQGYSAFDAGWVMAAQGLGAVISPPVAGWLTDRYGARPVVLSGVCALVLVTLGLAQAQPETTKQWWAILLVGRGFAAGLTMMPAFSAGFVSLSPAMISSANALSNTVQRMAASLGVAVIATVAAERVNVYMAHAGGPTSVFQHAVAQGFDDALLVTAGMTMLGMPAAVLLRRALPIGAMQHTRLLDRYRVLSVGLGAFAVVGLALTIVIAFRLV